MQDRHTGITPDEARALVVGLLDDALAGGSEAHVLVGGNAPENPWDARVLQVTITVPGSEPVPAPDPDAPVGVLVNGRFVAAEDYVPPEEQVVTADDVAAVPTPGGEQP